MGTSLKLRAALATAILLVVAAGCGGSPAAQAQSQAESVTKALYNNDVAGVQQNFEDSLKKQVNRSEVGLLSDKLHKLGDYKSLTQVKSDTMKNEYTYRADFTNGSAPVILRLDSQGKIAAYRVSLPQ